MSLRRGRADARFCHIYDVPRVAEIPLVYNEGLDDEWKTGHKLTERSLQVVLTRVLFLQHNLRRPEKAVLAARRAKVVPKESCAEYAKLLELTRNLEKECYEVSQKKVLEELKIDEETLEAAKKTVADITKVKEAAINTLLGAIRAAKRLSGPRTAQLTEDWKRAADSCGFYLTTHAEEALQLGESYGEDQTVKYEDTMTADTLYGEYKLLPVEAFACVS